MSLERKAERHPSGPEGRCLQAGMYGTAEAMPFQNSVTVGDFAQVVNTARR